MRVLPPDGRGRRYGPAMPPAATRPTLPRSGSRLAARVRAALPLLALLKPAAWTALMPRRVSVTERLAAFPTAGLPLEQPVAVRWNDHQVPWIEAATDRDLAFTLGLVHAHLRRGQLAPAKRLVRGRVSELAGPVANDLDHALRLLDFGYAALAIEAAMPPETRAWMLAFVDGLNWYQEAQRNRRPPPEYGLLGLRDEPWTLSDLLAIGRLAGADPNWLVFFSLLGVRDRPDWPLVWQRTLEAGSALIGSADRPRNAGLSALNAVLAGASRSGSNAVAVAPSRSTTGAALLAADPHLGQVLPNFWLLAGISSPSYRAVGLMPPGLPIMGLGRNPDLAWAGTNLHAAASDLYDVSGEPPDTFQAWEECIRTRFGPDRMAPVRRCRLGPIMSDAAVIPHRAGKEVLALRWTGHEGSDEITAFLGVMRARTAEEFRAAFATYGVAGQTMVCATRTGDIAAVPAVKLPRRSGPPRDLVHRPGEPDGNGLGSDGAGGWHGYTTSADLPWALNPAGGIVASANDPPDWPPGTPPAGFFFEPTERVERLRSMLLAQPRVSLADLAELQRDTLSTAALDLCGALVARIKTAGLEARQPALFERLRRWDGRYDSASAGAPAFETLLARTAQRLYAADAEAGRFKVPAALVQWAYLLRAVPDDLDVLPTERRTGQLAAALDRAARDVRRYPDWGSMHRMRVGFVLAALPVIGRLFTLDDYPVGGSRNTVQKNAHGLVTGRHHSTFGSQARLIADLSAPDATSFVLFGGQDGWLGSDTFADQVALWRKGGAITMPLLPETVDQRFGRVLQLAPATPFSGPARGGYAATQGTTRPRSGGGKG